MSNICRTNLWSKKTTLRDSLEMVWKSSVSLTSHWISGLHREHPVVVVDKIAHKFILGNDFLVQYRCDILNSNGKIVFWCKPVPYTLFRSTINLICPVICQARTEIEPYEEAIIPGLLDSYQNYNPNHTLLKPRKNELTRCCSRSCQLHICSDANSRIEHHLRTCYDS